MNTVLCGHVSPWCYRIWFGKYNYYVGMLLPRFWAVATFIASSKFRSAGGDHLPCGGFGKSSFLMGKYRRIIFKSEDKWTTAAIAM